MDDAACWRAREVHARAAAVLARLEVHAASVLAAEARCADLVEGSLALTSAARSRRAVGRAPETPPPAEASAFDRLQSEAMATAGGESGHAARLLVHRMVQARPDDADARSELDGMIVGAWERLEQRARARVGPDAPPELVARELIRYLGLDPP
jgi:hypothetical protein